MYDTRGAQVNSTQMQIVFELKVSASVGFTGMCDGGQCVECENDGHCPSGKWCKNKNLPYILNDCVNKYGNGGWCFRDAQCKSGKS